MGRFLHVVRVATCVLWLPALGAGAGAGCWFDDARAQGFRRCAASSECGTTETCELGVCAACSDPIDDDGDGVGNACDCAPADGRFWRTLANETFVSGLGGFSPIAGAPDWSAGAAGLTQAGIDGLHDGSFGPESSAMNEQATAVVTVTAEGADDFANPPGAFSLAGVLLRGASLDAGAVTAYWCGFDTVNHRVVIARTQGADVASPGTLNVIAQSAPIGAIAVGTAITISASAVGLTLSCAVDRGSAMVTVSDSQIAGGAFGLMTIGAAATFANAAACGGL